MDRGYQDPAVPPLLVLEECPHCDAPLRVRRRRADREPFLACSAWPRCTFAEDLDERSQRLARRIAELETAIADRDDELADLRGARAQLPADSLAKELREIIVATHPDKWPGNPLAHEACARLTALRDRLRVAA